MAKLSWKQAFINAVDAYRRAKGITDKIAVGSFPALLEEAIGSGGGDDEGVGGIIYRGIDNNGYVTKATVRGSIVPRYAFYSNTRLTDVELDENITKIDFNAFYQCKMTLTSLPKSLTTVGEKAFSMCSNLALTELPESLTRVESSGFSNCAKLGITEIPANLTYIGNTAFYSCRGLTTLTFKGTPTFISSSAFNSNSALTTINVPWAEGAVANAPWGATSATINYNYTGGE